MTGACRTKERRERRGPGLAAVQKCQQGTWPPCLLELSSYLSSSFHPGTGCRVQKESRSLVSNACEHWT